MNKTYKDMSVYIKNDISGYYMDVESDITVDDGYNVGTTWDDYKDGKYVRLTDEQLLFLRNNPTASVSEVFNMRMEEKPDPLPVFPPSNGLDLARRKKIDDIMRVDKAKEVFDIITADGVTFPTWLDKATRTSLMSCVIPSERSRGGVNTTLWCPGKPPVGLVVELGWLEDSILDLESYAKNLYDVTQGHIADVYAIDTLEGILAYDEKVGYPEIRKYVL